MTNRYVSKTGDNSDGLTLATAYNTLSPAYTDAVSGVDTILIDDGTYTGAEMEAVTTGYAQMNKALTIKAINTGAVTISPSVITATFKYQGNLEGLTFRVEGINFSGSNTNPNYHIQIANNVAVEPGTIEIVDCTFEDAIFYSVYLQPNDAMNITMDGCTQTQTRASTRAALYTNDILKGDIVVSDCNFTVANSSGSVASIQVVSTSANVTASISDTTIDLTTDGQTARGIMVFNVDDAVISGCTVTCQTDASDSGVAIQVDCDDAALTAHRAVITHNTVNQYANGGHCIFVGHESPEVGDHLANDALVFNNTITGDATFRAAGGHSLMFGWQSNGNSFNNKIRQVGLGLLCKGAIGGGHFCNDIRNFGESGGVGSGLQAKGANGVKYYGNKVTLDNDCWGTAFIAVRFLLSEAGINITAASRDAVGTVTITTDNEHGVVAGSAVTVSGLGGFVNDPNGSFIVDDAPTTTTFEYSDAGTIDSFTVGSADATVDNIGVESESNVFNVVSEVSGTNSPSLCSTGPNQSVTYKKNAYLYTSNITSQNATPMVHEGSDISIADWRTSHEDDLLEETGIILLAVGSGGGGGSGGTAVGGIVE